MSFILYRTPLDLSALCPVLLLCCSLTGDAVQGAGLPKEGSFPQFLSQGAMEADPNHLTCHVRNGLELELRISLASSQKGTRRVSTLCSLELCSNGSWEFSADIFIPGLFKLPVSSFILPQRTVTIDIGSLCQGFLS